MTRKHVIAFLAVLLLVLCGIFARVSRNRNDSSASTAPKTVYVDGPRDGGLAQMFTSNWEPSHLLAWGARCEVKGVFDNFDTGAGETVEVYFLDCDGKTGFVFQEWTTTREPPSIPY